MLSRNQQSTAGGAGGSGSTKKAKETIQANEQPDEDPLVAVILADSYDDYFAPLTIGTPRCLLPLANVPLIEYSIESATVTGVSHIYVLAGAHTAQIQRHLSTNLQRIFQNQGIGLSVLNTSEASSEGDALRELDALQIIRSDFLLYRGDSICTFDLTKAVQAHRSRRKLDKDVIMTMCCMPVHDETEMRSKALRPVHYVDPSNNQILHYELQHHFPRRKASMPNEILRFDEKSGYDEIDIRFDLVEAGVEVCSVDVPPLFSENFDYQSFSLDFVPGILTSDLLDSKFFLEIYKKEYGGRARNTATYDAISKSILRRWTYPLMPASSAWLGESYSERKGWKYIGKGVKIDRSAIIGSGTMLGANCALTSKSSVTSSILSRGVQVGSASQIVNCYLHTGVKIGSEVKMEKCIIGAGVIILDRVQLGKGCLIGAGCVIGPNVNLRAGTRVGLKKKDWEDSDDDKDDGDRDEEAEANADVPKQDGCLGSQSKGVLWSNLWQDKSRNDEKEEEDEDEVESEEIRNLRLHAIGYTDSKKMTEADYESESVSSIDGDSDLDDLDDDYGTDGETRSAVSSAFSNIAGANINLTLDEKGDTKEEQEALQARFQDFQLEAKASLQRALEEGHTVDNAAIELKTLRMASNVSLSQVRQVAIEVLVGKCKSNDAKQVQQLMSRWGKLITRISSDDEADAINLIQSYCTDHATHSALFVPLLKIFYNDDVFQEESFLSWWRGKASQSGTDKRRELRLKAQDVIRYILETDDESDSDEQDE